MGNRHLYRILTWLIAAIWIINGLFCKVLNLVPRHQEIVAAILGIDHSGILTILIGLAEILMGVWILTRIKTQLNAITQILIIGIMNALEFLFVPNLLLFGKFNSVLAFLLIAVICYHEFMLKPRLSKQV